MQNRVCAVGGLSSYICTQTRDEIISTMDVEQRMCKLATLVVLLVEYINRYNIKNAVNANHLQLLSLNCDEAIYRHRIKYEVRNNNNDDDNDNDEVAEDEIDGGAVAFKHHFTFSESWK